MKRWMVALVLVWTGMAMGASDPTPQIEPGVAPGALFVVKALQQGGSTFPGSYASADSSNDTLRCNTTGPVTDTSQVYIGLFTRVALDLQVTGDSSKVNVICYGGYCAPDTFRVTPVDTLAINTAGQYHWNVDLPAGAAYQHIFFIVQSRALSGLAKVFDGWLIRARY